MCLVCVLFLVLSLELPGLSSTASSLLTLRGVWCSSAGGYVCQAPGHRRYLSGLCEEHKPFGGCLSDGKFADVPRGVPALALASAPKILWRPLASVLAGVG